MDLVKKNLISIICGVVALLAAVAVLWPLGSYSQSLLEEGEKRTQVHQEAQRLLQKSRSKPILDPEKAQQEQLTSFPNESVIAAGKRVTDEVAEQSRAMLAQAVRLNSRPLLVPDCLPAPSFTAAFGFRDKYGQMQKEIRENWLRAGQPPTDADITQSLAQLEATLKAQIPILPNGQPDPIATQQKNAEFAARKLTLPDAERTRRATENRMYMNLDALDSSAMGTNVGGAGAPPPQAQTIWTAQVGLWIQTDLAQAIAAANKNAANVLDAPVKHLVKITVNPNFIGANPVTAPGFAAAGGFGSSYNATPAPAAPADPNAPVPLNMALSPTGRASNALYDVAHFEVQMIVDASKLPMVLEELSRNRFIAIRNVDLAAVDGAVEAAKGYIYGKDPVVRVKLECEALFLRQWTKELMPLTVKQALGIEMPTQPG